MCCCLVQSCCCGWQTLEHGLFIFAVFDIFLNLVMVCFSILISNAGIAGLNGVLILADVGLAFGAKLGVSGISGLNGVLILVDVGPNTG